MSRRLTALEREELCDLCFKMGDCVDLLDFIRTVERLQRKHRYDRGLILEIMKACPPSVGAAVPIAMEERLEWLR